MPATLTNFLARLNAARGDLPKLSERGLADLLRDQRTEQFERWLAVIKRVVRCRPNKADTACQSEKRGVFDEEHCALKLLTKQPFASCVHRSEERGAVELAGRSLLEQFLTLYKRAVETLLREWGHDHMFWAWSALWDSQVTANALENMAMSYSRRLQRRDRFSLTQWISDALLHDSAYLRNAHLRLLSFIRLKRDTCPPR